MIRQVTNVYAKAINEQSENLMTIRGLFEFDNLDPIPLNEVEPWTDIVKRLKPEPCLTDLFLVKLMKI